MNLAACDEERSGGEVVSQRQRQAQDQARPAAGQRGRAEGQDVLRVVHGLRRHRRSVVRQASAEAHQGPLRELAASGARQGLASCQPGT